MKKILDETFATRGSPSQCRIIDDNFMIKKDTAPEKSYTYLKVVLKVSE